MAVAQPGAPEETKEVRRFALKYDPPTVILEYRTAEGLFHYRMRIKNLSSQMVCARRSHTHTARARSMRFDVAEASLDETGARSFSL